MSRQINSSDPGLGFPSEKDFKEKGQISDADLTIANVTDPTKQIVFDASGQAAGKKVTIAAGANSGNATFTLPATTGTIATLTDIPASTPIFFAILSDQKTQNTGGGQFDSGDWKTRTLNTKEYDGIGITLSSNQFTLPAGTYIIYAFCPGYQIYSHQAKLYNITSSADVEFGSSEYSGVSNISNKSTIFAKVAPSTPTVYELRHQCSNSGALGFGVPANFGTEVYAQVIIVKIL